MADISSISIREDSLIWTEISKEDQTLHINRAVYDILPVFIHHKTIYRNNTLNQLANFLQEVTQKNNLARENIRLHIPGHFGLIRKVILDNSIPPEHLQDLIVYEFEKSWEESRENYQIFLPAEQSSEGEYIAMAIRTPVLEFLENVFNAANLGLESISPSCFSVEEFYRSLFPGTTGQSLLVGWCRHGFDVIITENQNFKDYFFKAYTKSYDPIEKVSEFDLANGFSNLIFDIQHPSAVDNPLRDIQTIYNYGYYFKPEWLDFIRSRIQVPSALFNVDSSTTYQIMLEDSQIQSDNLYQYIEAISNIF